jgi:hypothetical protein
MESAKFCAVEINRIYKILRSQINEVCTTGARKQVKKAKVVNKWPNFLTCQ